MPEISYNRGKSRALEGSKLSTFINMYIIRLIYINTYITITATCSRSSGSFGTDDRQYILLHTYSIIQLNKLTAEDQFSWKREIVLSIFHAAKLCLHVLTVAKLI